jgi:ceramide glucosyltransferase
MSLELACTLLGLGLCAEALRSHWQQRQALRPRPQTSGLRRFPSVSVIRPIRGLDTEAEDNIRAALEHGYPGEVETLFIFDDENEPALPLVHQAIEEFHRSGRSGRAQVYFCGQPPAGQTGKLNAMITGLKHAQGELIAFVDSDVRQDQVALKAVVQTLLTSPGAGAAFAPVIVTKNPCTVGDTGYALMLNGLYGPAAACVTAHSDNTMPFIMGQFMVFKRETLKAIGGLESAEGQLVDDMFLGQRVMAAGLRNVVSPHPVAIIQQGLGFREFMRIFIRWITFSRSGLPGKDFKLISWLRGIVFWLGLILAGLSLSLGFLWPALCGALAALAISWSINGLHHSIGGEKLPLRYCWVSFAILLFSPLVYLTVHAQSEVIWRGRVYHLDKDSRLAEGHS